MAYHVVERVASFYLGEEIMKYTAIFAAVVAGAMFAGVASADQFMTKQNERNGMSAPGDVVPSGGGASCGTAPAITSLPFSDSGTTVGAANTVGTLPAGCSNYTTVAGPDEIYLFTTGAGASVGVSLVPTTGTYDPAIYVLSTCGTASTCVVGADAGLAGGNETIAAQAFAPGTYGLYVDSFYSTAAGSGAYNLSVTGTLPVEVSDFHVE